MQPSYRDIPLGSQSLLECQLQSIFLTTKNIDVSFFSGMAGQQATPLHQLYESKEMLSTTKFCIHCIQDMMRKIKER